MNRTPLYELHERADAKFGAFAGYDMPLFYPAGIIAEHNHTRTQAGLFDICHMMHVEIAGADAAALVERLCPTNAGNQQIGSAQYTFFLNEAAGIIDDLIVTRLDDRRYLIVCNAGCADKDRVHIEKAAADFDATPSIIERGFVALQGPMAQAVLEAQGLAVADLAFKQAIEPRAGMFVSRTGYTGEDGFEIALPEDEIVGFVEGLLTDERVMLIGLGARDSLRLEAGLSLYGQDLDEDISPMEAGLTWAIPQPLREGGPYIGADALAQKRAAGRRRKRVGLKPEGRAPVRAGAALVDGSGRAVGRVTSGGFGPTVGHPVALGLIDVDADAGTLAAEVRGKQLPLEVAALPFTAHNYKR